MNNKKITARQEIVTGTKAQHTINIVAPVHFASAEAMMADYRAQAHHNQVWNPRNCSYFKTVGQAVGWIKKELRKHSWPYPTEWIVRAVSFDHGLMVRTSITLERVSHE